MDLIKDTPLVKESRKRKREEVEIRQRRGRIKKPTPSGIWTHDFWTTRRVFYRWPTTSAPDIKRMIFTFIQFSRLPVGRQRQRIPARTFDASLDLSTRRRRKRILRQLGRWQTFLPECGRGWPVCRKSFARTIWSVLQKFKKCLIGGVKKHLGDIWHWLDITRNSSSEEKLPAANWFDEI